MADEGMDWHLQKAITDILQADTVLAGFVGTRIYQDVTEVNSFPYIVIGDAQDSDDTVQCLDGSEIFLDIHVWSEEPGYKQVKAISARVKRLIHNVELSMDEERCVSIGHRITRTFADQDLILKHSIVTFRALTEVTSYDQVSPP